MTGVEGDSSGDCNFRLDDHRGQRHDCFELPQVVSEFVLGEALKKLTTCGLVELHYFLDHFPLRHDHWLRHSVMASTAEDPGSEGRGRKRYRFARKHDFRCGRTWPRDAARMFRTARERRICKA